MIDADIKTYVVFFLGQGVAAEEEMRTSGFSSHVSGENHFTQILCQTWKVVEQLKVG